MKNWLLMVALATGAFSVAEANQKKSRISSDNSAMNEKIIEANGLTAENQSNLPRDIEITTKIRERLVKDDALSTYAKNVKIIVAKNQVTLKGPVNTNAERAKIVNYASALAPRYKIYNQLSVVK